MEGIAGDGTIRVSGMTLEYRVFGPSFRAVPMIVMLHEGLGSVNAWGEFPLRLSERTGSRVFVYSRAGYGASPPSDRLSVDYIRRHALDTLPAILDEISFQRGILLGHSDGASMVTAYAGTVKDSRLAGIIAMAPHFIVESETLAEIRNARAAYQNKDLRQRLSRYHADVDEAFWGWNNAWLDPAFAGFNLREELARIRVPMLVIRGADDRYGTDRQVSLAEELCHCPLQTLRIPGCGHIPHREEPEKVLDVIEAFYRKVVQIRGDS